MCFEPEGFIKGQLARTYFYMSIRYYNIFECCDESQVNKFDLKPWTIETLKNWNNLYPVSQIEINRNNKIYVLQGNRNPFVDNVGWVKKIW